MVKRLGSISFRSSSSLPVGSLEAEDLRLVVSWRGYGEGSFPEGEIKKNKYFSDWRNKKEIKKLIHKLWENIDIFRLETTRKQSGTCWWWSWGSRQSGRGTRPPRCRSGRPRDAALRLSSRWTPQKKTPPTAGERCQPGGPRRGK